jgi:DNA-binding winged helix-turn-helix (wHTH) protein
MPVDGERNEVKFGHFVLDRKAGELRKRGIRVRVPDQSIKVLCVLVERPGDVITREELCQRLWPNGTIVEFEHGVNNAIRRLRAALAIPPGSPVLSKHCRSMGTDSFSLARGCRKQLHST